MTETQFSDFFTHGIVSAARLVGIPCRIQLANVPSFCVAIQCHLTSGEVALIATKRGTPKVYRVETALNLLRKMGFKDAVVDLDSITGLQQPAFFGFGFGCSRWLVECSNTAVLTLRL